MYHLMLTLNNVFIAVGSYNVKNERHMIQWQYIQCYIIHGLDVSITMSTLYCRSQVENEGSKVDLSLLQLTLQE